MQIRKMTNIIWVKTHLKQEKTTAAGISVDDWFGNNEADIQAKKGAEQHGYTASQQYDILNRVDLAKRLQQHMLKKSIIYITHPLVITYALDNKQIKGTPTGTNGRQIMMPERMGHEVRISGDYEYCLGCGRTTKAKHSTSAKL
eukprot:16433016-Heterocapsa_arctica.AAC.1